MTTKHDHDQDGTEMYRGYPVENIQEGSIETESPMTGQKYRVTKWVDKGDGKIVALEKELIEDE